MMVKLASILALMSLLLIKAPYAHGVEYLKHANAVQNSFIEEMQKKYGWICFGTGASMPWDVVSLSVSFFVCKQTSKEEARELLINALERFREIVESNEKLRPYLRYYPVDIDAVDVSLNFINSDGSQPIDGSITRIANAFGGNIVYYVANTEKKGGFENQRIAEETYEEALEALHLGKRNYISYEQKERQKTLPHTQEQFVELKKRWKGLSREEELEVVKYVPGDELKILGIEYLNFCNTVEEAIRERISGVAEKYFDEEFFKTLAEKQNGQPNGEYVGYWPNGELKVKVQWKNGKPDGHMHGWYPDCREAFKGYFKEGLKQGIQLSFYTLEENRASAMARLSNYNLDGKLSEKQSVYYFNGNLKAIANYRNGVLHGEVSLWGEREGVPLYQWKYRRGKLIAHKRPGVKK